MLNFEDIKKPITLCVCGEICKEFLPVNKQFTNGENVVTGMEN
jgi:hypothetical protein